MKNIFPERLEELIKQRNIKVADMSEKLGVSRKAIYNYMKGVIYPSTETMAKIADILGVSIDYLLGRINEPTEFVLMDEDKEMKEQIFFINRSYRGMNETERRIIYNLVKSINDEKKREKDVNNPGINSEA